MMNYRDIIHEMKMSGHYSEADELERSVNQGHYSEYDQVYSRDGARDGLSIASYAGDMAERAYDDLKYSERRERERQEEAIQHEQEMYARQRQEQAEQESDCEEPRSE